MGQVVDVDTIIVVGQHEPVGGLDARAHFLPHGLSKVQLKEA